MARIALVWLVLSGSLVVIAGEAEALGANYRGPFEGRVVDADTGAPIEGAVVFVEWIVHHMWERDSFFDTAEVRTDTLGRFAVPKKWSWNPWRTMGLDSRVIILKAGYSSARTHWGPLLEAKAILESLPSADRDKPGSGCDLATGDAKMILQCSTPGFPHKYPIRIEEGVATFHLEKILPTGRRNIDVGLVPEGKRRMLSEEIEKDNALAHDSSLEPEVTDHDGQDQ